MLRLQQSDFQLIRQLAESAYPEEFCAILIGRSDATESTVTCIIACRNIHPNPRRAYSIEPKAIVSAQRDAREQGLAVLGFLHSHPDHPPVPSPSDLELAYWTEHIYGIVSVKDGRFDEIALYQLQGDASGERKFVPVSCEIAADA